MKRPDPPATAKPPAWVEAARAQWTYRGQQRPAFAHEPQPGQRSVWDFPRPPALVPVDALLEVKRGDVVVARTTRGLAVLETAHPPTYYFPPDDVNVALLVPTAATSHCEWKGQARTYDVAGDPVLPRAAWSYPTPYEEFAALGGFIAFMPAGFSCFVDGERARPQGGGFYGGWITSGFAGPFKGDPGIGG